MDKKGVKMLKKTCALVLLGTLLMLGGCETAIGAGKGFAGGVASTAEGVGKDTCNLFGAIQSADAWIRKNLW